MKSLLSLWLILMFVLIIVVRILFSFRLSSVYFSFCFCNVSLIFFGLVFDIGVLIFVGLASRFFFVFMVFFEEIWYFKYCGYVFFSIFFSYMR